MTPLEAMAETLKPHVWDNDPDMARFCLRALRTLKASGYELVPCETDAGRMERVKGNAEYVFGLDVRADALAHLKAKAEEMRKKQ